MDANVKSLCCIPETSTILYVKYMSIEVNQAKKSLGEKKNIYIYIHKESLSNLVPNFPTMSWPTRVEEKAFWMLTSFS